MAPFRFRLEQVLGYRKQLEEAAMQALAEAEARRAETRERLAQIAQEFSDLRLRMENFASLDSGDRYVLAAYEAALRAEQTTALVRLAQQDLDVDRCRRELVAKSQERSLLDKLKEKQAERHREQERLHEQRTNDETATLRFIPSSF